MTFFDYILAFMVKIQHFLMYKIKFSCTVISCINYYNVNLQDFTLPVLMRPFFLNLFLNNEAESTKKFNVPNIIKCHFLFHKKIARTTIIAN